MGRLRYLVIHKNEWERLKTQAGPPEEPIKDNNEYIKGLIEKSQSWIKTWPDTVEGHVATVEKLKKKQHEEEIAYVRAFSNKKRQENTEGAIKKARQLLFENSCYGRKLKSALLELKTLEERDIQIQFKREIKKQAADLEKKQTELKPLCTFGLDEKLVENEQQSKKKKAMECAQANKNMTEIKKQNNDKTLKQDNECKVEETIIKQVFDKEAMLKEETKRMEKETIEEFLAEQRHIKEIKAKTEEFNEALTEAYCKDQEKVKCKILRVFKEINKDRQSTSWSKSCYNFIEKIRDVEDNRYNRLVEKGIKDLEDRNSKLEQENVEKQKREKYLKCLVAQRNKIYGEIERKSIDANKCFCDRQCLITKSHKIPSKKAYEYEEDDIHVTKPSFLKPRNKLVEELRKREKEPSPWNGGSAAHAQFARDADDTLRQCTYKNLARKVVDEYKKINALDSDNLPILNY